MKKWISLILAALILSWTAQGYTLTVIKDYEYSPTAILALSLARSGNIIPESDMAEVIASLAEKGTVPKRYQASFEKLLHTAQMLLEIKSGTHYFPVGFEFESGHHTQDSAEYEVFEAGAKAIAHSVKETFGTQSAPKTSIIDKEGDETVRSELTDDSGAKWLVVQEYVRDDARSTTPTGWETVSPPIFNRDYLRNMAGFILRLGTNPYGREAEFTGAHQTYDLLPQGVQFEPGLAGRTAANYLLLMQQFSPAIFKNLQVERYGGYKNFFIRPIVFDHAAMLHEISNMPPEQLTIQSLERLMNGKYALSEFTVHVSSPSYSDARRKELLAWADSSKMKYVKLWKYHDLRIHFNPAKPERTLVETRIGDYRQGAPEEILRVTYFNQKLLERAYQMAKENKIHKIDIPARIKGETDDGYWKRLAAHPASSDEAMFNVLKLDETGRRLIKGVAFEPRAPKFAALSRPSYGFEKEFIGQDIVDLIVPKDPETRARWRGMSFDAKVEYFAALIADEDQREKFLNEEYIDYTKDTRRIVTVEFEADTMKYPFLDPDLFIEDSGNFEIKSNGRDIYDIDKLIEKVQITDKKLKETTYGMHAHLFLPDSVLQDFRTKPGMAEAAGSFLERLSMLMQIEDYRSADNGANHGLDSWSLDRYSQKDIKQFVKWLKRQGKLGNIDQKYHNVGVREVTGGLDIELRAVGEDIPYMRELMTLVSKAFIQKEFGFPHRFGQNRPLFHDFTKAADMGDVRQFILVDAVSKRYQLTPAQKDILYKMQFEIYKPSMAEYIFFDDYMAHNSVDADKMDTRYIRTNFESNIALPILNYEEQPYLSQDGIANVQTARDKFVDAIYKLVLSVEKDAKYKFVGESKDFLHLADWLERSTHPSRPDFSKVDKNTAKVQRRALESLVKKMRGLVVQFTKTTDIPTMIRNSFDAEKAKATIKPMPAKKVEESKAQTKAQEPQSSERPRVRMRMAPQTCEAIFRAA